MRRLKADEAKIGQLEVVLSIHTTVGRKRKGHHGLPSEGRGGR
ncbi:MAG: hypothetical protein P4M11_09135 [Candidatus Pacebacteria bacterium]|nr:hypothetical protein [Candidatus Paceibacterota bacterium]